MSTRPEPLSEPAEPMLGRVIRSRFVRVQLVIAALLLVGLVVAEVVIREFEPGYANRVWSPWLTSGHAINMQPEGYRAPRVELPKPPGTVRILAMGDSTTFGTAVAAEEAWAAQAAKMLSERLGTPVDSVNAGQPGYDVPRMNLMIEAEWMEMEPDLLGVTVTANMPTLQWNRRDEPPRKPSNPYLTPPPPPTGVDALVDRAKNAARSLGLVGFFSINVERLGYWVGINTHRIDPEQPQGGLFAHGWLQHEFSPADAEEAWAMFEGSLAEFRDTADRLGVPMVVACVPSRFMLTDRVVDNLKRVPMDRITISPCDRVSEIAARVGVPSLDIRDDLRGALLAGESVYVTADYSHLNARGNEILAGAFSDWFADALAAFDDGTPLR